jgi:nicotinamide-nucleotide amidase
MTTAILCIGTELTRGELVNTNATWLAEELTRLGLEITELAVTDDDRGRIEAFLARLSKEHDLIVCTGGLGPTTDDLTTECVARVLGTPLERDADSFERISTRMTRFGRTMAPSNAKQADFPRGARILPNDFGTAPGFSVKIDRALAFFLPGVPREMKGLFEKYIAPEVAPLIRDHGTQILLRTFGVAESTINDKLAGVERAHGVTLGYRAHFPEIDVKVIARASSAELALSRARAAAEDVRARLADTIYGEGPRRMPEVVAALLLERGLSLGIAESCTGGLVSKLLTDASGASAFFKGAAVTYSNELKQKLLGVSAELLEQHGAVSEPIARSMAEGALSALSVDVALSITGVAGPNGGTAEKPVGLVHFAVATRAGTTAYSVNFPSNREQIRMLSAYRGLWLVRRVLLGGHEPAA